MDLGTVLSIVSVVLGIGLFVIAYSLKPNLLIENVLLVGKYIKVDVKNEGRFETNNVRIEVCALDLKNKDKILSYHLKSDFIDFLILPNRRNIDPKKTFVIKEISESAKDSETYDGIIEKLKRNQYVLRVRIHSYHSFSGLGKSKEALFEYRNNQFEKV